LISVENVTKYYGKRLALDEISFHVEKNEIVGFLGPNAAGKTTTMRILSGFVVPSKGQAWINGKNVVNESLQARKNIGYLPESVPLYSDMTVRSYLEFFKRLRKIEKKTAQDRIEYVLEVCHLNEYMDVLIRKLSKGFKQRVGLAQVILSDPKVLILDEPTVGIDPIQVAMTRNIIRELGKKHTVLLSSHILSEISTICDRVIIINKGKIVAQDKIRSLSEQISDQKRIRCEIDAPKELVLSKLNQIEGVHVFDMNKATYVIECKQEKRARAEMLKVVVQQGWNLISLNSEEMTLEDIFLKLISKDN